MKQVLFLNLSREKCQYPQVNENNRKYLVLKGLIQKKSSLFKATVFYFSVLDQKKSKI